MLINVELDPHRSLEWRCASKVGQESPYDFSFPADCVVPLLVTSFRSSVPSSMLIMVNMGLYTDLDAKATYFKRDPMLQAVVHVYMFVMQIILLNMLIALMSESNDRVRSVSKLVAQFERAKLILHWERRLVGLKNSHSRVRRCLRILSGMPSGTGRHSVELLFPKWIHVLTPDDARQDASSRDMAQQVAAALKVANTALFNSEESNAKLTRSMGSMQNETKRLSSMLVDMQEKQGNLLREVKTELRDYRDPARPRRGSHVKRDTSAPSAARPTPTALALSEAANETSASRDSSTEMKARADKSLAATGRKARLSKERAPLTPQRKASGEGSQPAQSERNAGGGSSTPSNEPSQRNWFSTLFSGETPCAADRLSSALATADQKPKEKARVSINAGTEARPRSAVMSTSRQEEHARILLPDPLPLPRFKRTDPGAGLKEMLKLCEPPTIAEQTRLAQRIAQQMRSPTYTLRQYYTDIRSAFPELRFYFVTRVDRNSRASPQRGTSNSETAMRRREGSFRSSRLTATTTSGNTGSQEYLRTVGAFFALYWLSRIGIDGERGFSFGVDDESWEPLTVEQINSKHVTDNDRPSNSKKSRLTSDMQVPLRVSPELQGTQLAECEHVY
jgi:hypothetical protein